MKRGVSLSGVTVLGGIWIGIAPFWLGYAPKTGPVWTSVVAVSVWLGLLIVVAGLMGLVGFWAAGLGALEREWRRRSRAARSEASPSAPSVATPPAEPVAEDDADAQWQGLVDRVRKDHSLAFEQHS